MKYEIYQIDKQTYQIRYYFLSAADVYLYLLIGEDKTMLIDCAYAGAPIKQIVDSLTNKPIFVACSHGHFDHIGCASLFEEAYLSKSDFEVAKLNCDYIENTKRNKHILNKRPTMKFLLLNRKLAKELEQSCHIEMAKFSDWPESMKFDLGNRVISILPCPGHTKGSVVFYDETNGYLFTGDSICSKGVLLGFEESTSLLEYKESILKLKQFCQRNTIKSIFPGHHTPIIDTLMIDKYLNLIEMIGKKEVENVYVDNGICSGYCANDGEVKIIYNYVYGNNI